jgi:DNA modification methylase
MLEPIQSNCGTPKEISDTFNDDEFRDIAERLTQARASFIMLHDLNVEDHFLKGEARDLLHMAMKDLDSASSVLKHASNVQGSIVFSGKYPRMQGILCLP